jgi:eukaryotic translation initiation factor 2C
MKANLKFAGINHTADGVSNWLDKTLVIGSDLTHPGNGAVDQCPSIAAVVSSVGKDGGLFYGRLWLQRKSDVSNESSTIRYPS